MAEEIKEKIEEDEKKEGKEPLYTATPEDQKVITFISKRIEEMKQYRKNLKVEDDWRDADKEYTPSEIPLTPAKKRLEQNQDTGLRSRLVTVSTEEDGWRSNVSDPTLLSKIQTAISIIIDRDPRAVMTALVKKFEKTSKLANGLWKRNWKISDSKHVLKLFAFDLAKYGWAVARTYPRLIKYNKKILTEYDAENPEKSKWEDKELVWYNDVAKQRLDPYRTWIDEMAKPYDSYSRNECYYELDFSSDSAKVEFDKYTNFKFIGTSAKQVDLEGLSEEQKVLLEKERKDIITIGFFESRLKDLYIIYVPSKKIVLYAGHLPNDDGLLSLWDTPWILKDSNTPYGISLWKIIKGKKELYDKMMNMTMDELVLSILKMFFYTGTTDIFADGKIKIQPGKGKQIQNGDVKWLEVPPPGKEAWAGLQFLKSGLDDDSGIPPILEGEITGKTLGEILHAKEASLKRLKIPVENISYAIEQDAYLTLSWMGQIYSTPEIKNFATSTELMAYEKESGLTHNELFGKLNPENPEEIKEYKATFLPELSLHLEEKGGQLIESKESKYFQVGKDIKTEELGWRGMIDVVPTSILAPSEELEKQRKSEVFNLLVPLLGQDPTLVSKASKQLLKANDEDPEDWLPDSWLELEKTAMPQLFVDNPALQNEGMIAPGGGQIPLQTATGGQTIQGKTGMTPNQGGNTVVPQNQIQGGNKAGGILGAIKSALKIKQRST
jgi:hypothetical protein